MFVNIIHDVDDRIGSGWRLASRGRPQPCRFTFGEMTCVCV